MFISNTIDVPSPKWRKKPMLDRDTEVYYGPGLGEGIYFESLLSSAKRSKIIASEAEDLSICLDRVINYIEEGLL